jgi:hypothetical protein
MLYPAELRAQKGIVPGQRCERGLEVVRGRGFLPVGSILARAGPQGLALAQADHVGCNEISGRRREPRDDICHLFGLTHVQ